MRTPQVAGQIDHSVWQVDRMLLKTTNDEGRGDGGWGDGHSRHANCVCDVRGECETTLFSWMMSVSVGNPNLTHRPAPSYSIANRGVEWGAQCPSSSHLIVYCSHR